MLPFCLQILISKLQIQQSQIKTNQNKPREQLQAGTGTMAQCSDGRMASHVSHCMHNYNYILEVSDMIQGVPPPN